MDVRMPSRADKVEARVDTEVNLILALRLLLLAHVRLVLVVNEVDNGGPRVAVVDVVAKAGAVDDRQLRLELLLLELGLDDLHLGQLVELLVVPTAVALRGRQLGREKSVDKGRLAQPGFACRPLRACSLRQRQRDIPTTIIVKCAPRFATILCRCC